MATRIKRPLIWIDCEMTGLDLKSDTIMSMCCIITDGNLNVVDSLGYEAIVHHDKETLNKMNEWCTKTHGESGLTEACLNSTTTPVQAAEGLLEYVKKYVPDRRVGLLAGNSVHCDKEFLRQDPYGCVIDHLNHRILDVSAIKEAARRWSPPEILDAAPAKKSLHEARADILESIAEARYYQNVIFKRATLMSSDKAQDGADEPD